MTKISACIITLNEENHIAQCILSVIDTVDEVIVLDSGSTDRTTALARELGAKVFLQPYLGDGFQKNKAADFARNNWIFSLDADERLSPELQAFLKSEKLKEGVAYSFKRKNHVSTRWIRFGDAYPDWLTRLYQKSLHKYQEVVEHSYVKSNRVTRCNLDIIHYGTGSLVHMYEKAIKFAKRSAKKRFKSGAAPKSPILSGFFLFFRLYFIKLGFLGGSDSFHHCFSAALRSFYKHSFHREYVRDPSIAAKLDVDSIW